MIDKMIWLVGFIVDVVVFTVLCVGMTIWYLLIGGINHFFFIIFLLLMGDPMQSLSITKEWLKKAKKFIISTMQILNKRIKDSFQSPSIIRKEE